MSNGEKYVSLWLPSSARVRGKSRTVEEDVEEDAEENPELKKMFDQLAEISRQALNGELDG